KFVTILTILALVLSAVLPVQIFAADDIGYEGRICRDLGILKGETGIVDGAYLETRPSRLQAAIMFLRLKGLEQDALDYTRGNNFKDTGVVAWKEGRNLLSYLKDHPELGWIGDGVNFMPYSLIDSRAYYKVLLESLGYKQKIDGDGDFAWSSVLEFAAEKGLDKAADVKNFTVRSLAIATVEALNTNMKNSRKKLIEHLVDIGDVDKGDAMSLGLYSKELEAEVKAVRAISNSKVEVVFEEAVDGSDAAEEDLYDIRHLDIKGVAVKNASAVIIDTSAMSDSTTYTLVFNDKNYSFRGLKKDGYAPKLIKAECKDTDMVELSFDRVIDNETAQDTGTYSISGADVKSAELDSTNTKVRLITSGIQAGRSYELKIHDIKNGDGVKTKLITKRFTGKKDTTPPKLSKLTVLNNVRLLLEFSDSNGLDKASAQDEDNYRITQSGGSLDVIEAKVKDRDDDGLWDSVELVTESQEPGRAYTLIIEDISDASVLENKITREIKKEFRGKSKDKTAPTVARNPKAVTDTMVEIEFSDANALDIQSACDIDNYDMDEDLEIREIKIKDPNNLYSEKGRTVILITSEMEKSESYTLVIRGIADEFGNEMKTSSSAKKYRFKGAAKDRTPPYITSVECIDSRTIEMNFDNILDEESAENIANYRIDGLALVTKAMLKDGDKTVRLTVSSLPSDRSHTVLLNNIKDLSGNALSNVSVSVLYGGSLYDDDPPEVAYIDAVNESEVWIHFEEEVYAESAVMMASGVKFKQVGSVLDDGTTVVMQAPVPMDDDEEYEVTKLTGVCDLRNNAYELESNLDFYGTDIENDPPEVDYWDQMDVRRFRVVFTEPVLIAGSGVSGIKNPSGVSINWTSVLNPDEEDTNEAYSTVDYIASKDIPADKEFKFDFTEMVSDYVGLGAYDEDDDDHGDSGSTILESYMEDDEEPYIEYVEAITRCKVQIVFSEAMRLPGRYEITYEDDNNREKTIDIELVEVDSKDNTRVNIFTEDQMSDEYIYVLEPKSAAADIAGNKLDIDDLEIEFAGTNIMSSDYIQGVEILNAYTLKVSKSSRIDNVKSLYELDEDGDVIKEDLIESKSRVSDNVYRIISTKPLLRDVRYKITVDGLDYKFYGGVANGDLELKLPEREITYDGMDFKEHFIEGYRANGDTLDIDEKDDYFKIDSWESLRNGELLYLYVIQDGEIIYGTRVKVEGMPMASSSKEITSFSFTGLDTDVVGNINVEDNIIILSVPYGTEVDHLVSTFKCSEDAVVKVGSEIQVSGKTENDFSQKVTYTVKAQDGSTRDYTVTVTVAPNHEKLMKEFGFADPKAAGIIDEAAKSISVKVPFGTDVTKLAAVVNCSDNSIVRIDDTVQKSGETINNFTDPVKYTVMAQNGSMQDYSVTVLAATADEKEIVEFHLKIDNTTVKASINNNNHEISAAVPAGTDLTNLVANFIYIGKSVYVGEVQQFSGITANDFTKPIVYTINAHEGMPMEYIITVTVFKDGE
ncbi:MAG: hypothetical protein PHS15_04245, partial [Clostridiaceae bacterium]|nr:hypothetical protein [Clostridiaceae bacterium]